MLTLDLTSAPRWVDLIPGLRVQLRPLTTALMVAARADPALDLAAVQSDDNIGGTVATEALALTMAKALARQAILDWEGVGDAEGQPLPVSPAAIDALLDIWPVFEAFQTIYVSKGLLLDAEKNVSPPLPIGSSAGAFATALPAKGRARTARVAQTGP
ncbi:hypothetical protein [Aquibium sp. ELW1220]|uniref:hypothetical protein n=1 Tax=Aquibium sp. ELW1220 TaxID=2976766 RepID=UPI0025AFA48E|nr:hypothetical protein [Aquibium sp. ELW1220]MDN2583971.1 hypothetical protein [Aquibium sp. ELW1220]